MSYLNIKQRMLETKIVYYGAGLSGKTTNLEQIRDRAAGGRAGEMMSLNTDGDRTLFFDWLPFDLGKIRGCEVKMQLYTVPGQAKYVETRKRVLRDADGIVVVLDSQSGALERNRTIVNELNAQIRDNQLQEVPLVVQANKRDLPAAMRVEELLEELGLTDVPAVDAVACDGKGVFETLRKIGKLVVTSVQKRLEAGSTIARGTASQLDGPALYEGLVEAGVAPAVSEPHSAQRPASDPEPTEGSGSRQQLQPVHSSSLASKRPKATLPPVPVNGRRTEAKSFTVGAENQPDRSVAMSTTGSPEPSKAGANAPKQTPHVSASRHTKGVRTVESRLEEAVSSARDLGRKVGQTERAVLQAVRGLGDALKDDPHRRRHSEALDKMTERLGSLEQMMTKIQAQLDDRDQRSGADIASLRTELPSTVVDSVEKSFFGLIEKIDAGNDVGLAEIMALGKVVAAIKTALDGANREQAQRVQNLSRRLDGIAAAQPNWVGTDDFRGSILQIVQDADAAKRGVAQIVKSQSALSKAVGAMHGELARVGRNLAEQVESSAKQLGSELWSLRERLMGQVITQLEGLAGHGELVGSALGRIEVEFARVAQHGTPPKRWWRTS